MTTDLLTTKLYVPPLRPSLVSRPRLIAQLDEGLRLGHKLTLISAPAGFGKSTLLSEWLSGRGGVTPPLPAAWLSLDEADNDLVRFLTYLIAALRMLEANIGESVLGALQASQPPVIASVLTALINELAAIPGPFALVLDDYHLIDAQPIHDAVTFLLDHLPPGMHWVIATRKDPLLPLARLRGRRELTELRADDLRFTLAETAALLNQVLGLGLSAGNISALEKRTEGWITGLQLAALALQGTLSLQGRADATSFIEAFTGSHHYVLDYLVEEVLHQQSVSIQAFLVQTSILKRLTGPLCDAVTGRGDGRATLEQLARSNLFIIPLDDERRWYRYHHLFADLLRVRLSQVPPFAAVGAEAPAGIETVLHRRASAWFEEEGLTAEAIDHASAAGDFERTARLIEGNAWAMLMGGETMMLLGWVSALPDKLVRSRPWLCIYHALALLLSGRLEPVEPRLRDAEGGLHDVGWPAPETLSLLGHAAAIRAYTASYRGDALHAIAYAGEALACLPEEALGIRSMVTFALGAASYLRGDVTGSRQAFTEAGAMARASGNIHLAVPASSAVAGLQVMLGQLHRAARTYQEALELALASSRTAPLAARAYSGMSTLDYEWNDLEAATRHAREAIRLGLLWGNADVLASSHAALACTLQAQGDPDAARHALEEAEQLARKHHLTPGVPEIMAACRVRLWLGRGDLLTAAGWATERQLALNNGISPLNEVEQIAVARVLVVGRQWERANSLLARLRQAAETGGREGRLIEILAVQAAALQAQDDVTQAVATLEHGLSLAAPEGYIRTFMDEGESMARLLRTAAARGVAPEYVRTLLAAFRDEATGDRGAPETADSVLTEPLGQRELEVLRLIDAGLSNNQIAEELCVAVSTVKKHINHIYDKLDVGSRTQALAKAREARIL